MAAAVKHSLPADGRAERWREHRENRRAGYIDAAVRALEEFGPEATMEQIAAVAGVAKPKLYRYFADRADLVNAVGDRCGREVAHRLGAVANPVLSLRATVAAGLDAFLRFVEENPNTVRFLLNSVGSTNGQNVIIDQGRMIAGLLVPLMNAGDSPSDAAEPLAHAMIGSILGATDWWLLQSPDAQMPRPRLVEHLTTVVVGAAQGVMAGLDPDCPLISLLA
ncbi:TetR/AcrR family transcriptional regulator [Jatrophihabitans sp.]|uniref:TetR/AcrR family transcriptional regulator n=1 Tax=Jatrophihabitans sp. TaxID=1932789 RepID=UPI0030C660C4|nr:Transcriptional regulator, TetR family [Jatrophihabitans sp.]